MLQKTATCMNGFCLYSNCLWHHIERALQKTNMRTVKIEVISCENIYCFSKVTCNIQNKRFVVRLHFKIGCFISNIKNLIRQRYVLFVYIDNSCSL